NAGAGDGGAQLFHQLLPSRRHAGDLVSRFRHRSDRGADPACGEGPPGFSAQHLLHQQTDLRARELVYPPAAQRGGAHDVAQAAPAQHADGDLADAAVSPHQPNGGPTMRQMASTVAPPETTAPASAIAAIVIGVGPRLVSAETMSASTGSAGRK